MGAIVNGLAAHGGFVGYGSTFLVFSDYMRPPIRLAALMGLHVIHVFTHDSLALGEDGPTHQPVEQLASLRAIPRLTLIRPCDANETAVAWQVAIETRDRPVLLALTRQDVATLDRSALRERRRPAPRRLRAERSARRDAAPDPDRERLRGRPDRRRRRAPARRRRRRALRLDAELGAVRCPAGELSRRRAAADSARRGSRSSSASRKAGTATSARTVTSSASTVRRVRARGGLAG